MSSSPALEPSSPPTTPSSPALRASECQAFQTSTPNYVSKKQSNPPLNVVLPSSALASPPTYGEPTLTPPPRSPGIPSPATPASGDVKNHPPDGTSSDKSSETAVGVSRTPSTVLSRKESYKAQRQHYRREKKRVASALLHSIEDPSVVVLADWLKVRGSLKSWTKLWCVLKPGLLLLYKSSKAKSSHWVGTVLLTSCQVIERPSKKDGFCFKLYHPLEQSIWAPRGPHNETIGAVVQPLPTAHLIFRAPSPAAGHCWLDGMELALRCSNAMLRCSRSRPEETAAPFAPVTDNISHEELEKHFNEHVVLKLSDTPSPYNRTPLMSVSDYSPKNTEKKEKKSKWAQIMESFEHMSKEQETTDSQTPEKDNIFSFMKDKALMQNLGRASPSASSAKVIIESKKSKRLTKSLASSPLRTDLTKRPILKCFELPKLSLTDKKDKFISPSTIEDNLMKIVMALPKRRSSTPSTKLTSKNISKLRKSGAKTDSENDEVFSKLRQSEVICDTPDNIIITKTSPSDERFFRYSSTSTDDPWDCGRKSPDYNAQKYSLIDYGNLPSISYESCKSERRDERLHSQNVYVAGKIVSHELAGAASDSDSSGCSGAGMPETAPDRAAGRLDPARRVAALYTPDTNVDTGAAGELVEEVAEENKSLLWFLLKQVRPGMDLSKVVLPTFILEPRSFLDKLSDNYYHADILAQAKTLEDPYQRFKLVLRWYLSGLYRKPKGLKKPYNPVLGETFRCCWRHPDHTHTYYIAEQVSHHPPVSAFYVSNRKDGFVIEGSLLARSKFYGNSTSAILEGCARVHLLQWNETYITTAPYAHCKGIVVGTLSMELGGKVHIVCNETGYSADIEFKLRSFLGGADQTNSIVGRIKRGKDTVASIDGYWDGRIDIKDKSTGEESNLLDVAMLKQQRLPRFLVKLENQEEFESQRLWLKVSEAINSENQVVATEEKTIIEEAQRERARNVLSPWVARLFRVDPAPNLPDGIVDQGWRYKHANIRPWQPQAESLEYEEDFVIKSVAGEARSSAAQITSRAPDTRRRHSDSDSRDERASRSKTHARTLKQTLHAIDNTLRDQSQTLERLTAAVETLSAARRPQVGRVPTASHSWDLFGGFVLAMVLQSLLNWLFYQKA